MDNKRLKTLLEKEWGSDDGTKLKMVEHCMKRTVYMEHGDKIISVCDKKPMITKTLWYDDERPIPDKSKELFINENMLRNAQAYIKERDVFGRDLVLIPMYGYKDGIWCFSYGDHEVHETVSDELLEKANKIIEAHRQKYKARLERYWNSYSDHVSCRGYWVNR